MAKKHREFSFTIGRPWHPHDPDSSICIYAYGSEVHHGTVKDAKGFRDYINEKVAVEHKNAGESGKPPKYRIYQLIELPE